MNITKRISNSKIFKLYENHLNKNITHVMHYKICIGGYIMSIIALNKKCGCKKDCECFTIYDDIYDETFQDFYYNQCGNKILKIGIYQIFVTFTDCAKTFPNIGTIEIEVGKKNKYLLSKTLYGDYIINLRDSIDIIDSVNIEIMFIENCKICDLSIIDYIYGFI